MTDATTPTEVAQARRKLEDAGRNWHKAANHPGPYGKCDEKSCYHTHGSVSR